MGLLQEQALDMHLLLAIATFMGADTAYGAAPVGRVKIQTYRGPSKGDYDFAPWGYYNTQPADLQIHHSGEKSNKCNQCEYASSQAGHLREHSKTHSGVKPNKCN